MSESAHISSTTEAPVKAPEAGASSASSMPSTPAPAESSTPAPAASARSDLARAFAEDGARKTHVGGQALLEGIMMRGKFNWAVAVRTPEGDIYTEEHDLASGRPENSWMNKPLIRGCRALVESLALGFKALEIAATHAFEDEEEEPSKKKKNAKAASVSGEEGAAETSEAETPESAESDKQEGGAFGKAEMALSMVLGVVLAVVLFIVAPALITNLLVGDYNNNPLLWNIVDGVLRIAVFIFYIWVIGRMEDIRRMFGYHGAEHKTIHCYEHGLPLTPENARSFPCLHVRCGTAFLIMVLVIAIFVYTVLPLKSIFTALGVPDGPLKLLLLVLVRLVFLPVIAGISYEITVKWAGSRPDNPLVKIILWPGMQMQRLTTREPDDGQIECAITAMNLVLKREECEARRSHEAG